METFREVGKTVTQCTRCTRLVSYCQKVAREKKREFRDWDYWGKPVPGFGDPKASLWIVGLAPAAHGGNRTGRMFTGDSSGNWLYRALYETGFANQPTSTHREDGLKLEGAYISAACRCAPPDNKPTPEELRNCAPFLEREAALLTQRRLIVALGSIGFDTACRFLKSQGASFKPKPIFGHGALHRIGNEQILCSYHPSRQNTQTGRLKWEMWLGIFEKARELIKTSSRE